MNGFAEVSYAARFRVGSHRLASAPADTAPLREGRRMFTFL